MDEISHVRFRAPDPLYSSILRSGRPSKIAVAPIGTRSCAMASRSSEPTYIVMTPYLCLRFHKGKVPVAEAGPSANGWSVFLVAGRTKVCLIIDRQGGAIIGSRYQDGHTSVERVIPPPETHALSSEPVQSLLGSSFDTTTVIVSVYSLITQMQGGTPCPARRAAPNRP